MSRLLLVPLALAISVMSVASIGRAAEEQEAARLRNEEEKIKAELPALIERIETLSDQLKAVQAERQKVEEQAKRAPDNAERSSTLAALQATLSRNARELQNELSKYESTLQTKTKQLAEIGQQVKQTAEKARNEFKRGPGEEVAQRIQQLQKQLAEATEAGKKEIADRLKKEIKDYAVETATEKMQQAKRNAEQAFKQQMEAVEKASRQQMEAMEKRIHQLREQGQPEIAERLAAQLKGMIQSLAVGGRNKETVRSATSAILSTRRRNAATCRQAAKRLVPPLEALAKATRRDAATGCQAARCRVPGTRGKNAARSRPAVGSAKSPSSVNKAITSWQHNWNANCNPGWKTASWPAPGSSASAINHTRSAPNSEENLSGEYTICGQPPRIWRPSGCTIWWNVSVARRRKSTRLYIAHSSPEPLPTTGSWKRFTTNSRQSTIDSMSSPNG